MSCAYSQPQQAAFDSPAARSVSRLSTLVVLLAVAVVLVLEEELLVGEISGKGNRRDAEAGECAVEAVPPRELSRVTPRLAKSQGRHQSVSASRGVVGQLTKQPCHVGGCDDGGGGDFESGAQLGWWWTNALSQGSYLGWPAAAANLLMSKPVRLGLGPLSARNILMLPEKRGC